MKKFYDRQQEMEQLRDMQQQYRGREVKVMGVSMEKM